MPTVTQRREEESVRFRNRDAEVPLDSYLTWAKRLGVRDRSEAVAAYDLGMPLELLVHRAPELPLDRDQARQDLEMELDP